MKDLIMGEEATLKEPSPPRKTVRMSSYRSKLLTPKIYKPVLMTEEAFFRFIKKV